MFDGNVLLWPAPVIVGAGYRYTKEKADRAAYGSFGFAKQVGTSNDLWFIRTSIGPSIVQFHIGIAGHWPRRNQ